MQTCRPKYEVREHFAEAVELISSHQNLKDLLTFAMVYRKEHKDLF